MTWLGYPLPQPGPGQGSLLPPGQDQDKLPPPLSRETRGSSSPTKDLGLEARDQWSGSLPPTPPCLQTRTCENSTSTILGMWAVMSKCHQNIFTARVRSVREGTVFTGVCLFTFLGGNPFRLMGVTPSGWWGVSHPADRGVPHLANSRRIIENNLPSALRPRTNYFLIISSRQAFIHYINY